MAKEILRFCKYSKQLKAIRLIRRSRKGSGAPITSCLNQSIEMKQIDQVDHNLPDWLFNIVEKHDIGLWAEEPRGGALVLVADTQYLLQEILDATSRERWFTPRIRRQMHKAIDMLIDAERLSSLPH